MRRALALLLLSSVLPISAARSADDLPTRVFESKFLEPEVLKADALEPLLNRKVSDLMIAAGVPEEQFKSVVTVKVEKKKAVAAPPEGSKKAVSDGPLGPDASTIDAMSFLSADAMIRRFENGQGGVKGPKPEKDQAETPDLYDVTRVDVNVGLSEEQKKERAAETEAAIKAALEPIFGNRLNVKVNTVPSLPRLLDKILNWVYKLQPLAIAALLATALLIGLILSKLIAGVGSRALLRMELDHKKNLAKVQEPEAKEEEKKEEPVLEEPPVAIAQVAESAINEERDLQLKIRTLQKQISAFGKQHPDGVTHAVQDWVNSGESTARIAMAMETLINGGVGMGKFEVRTDMVKALKDATRGLATLTRKETRDLLDEIYWDLIASKHFGENLPQSPFVFLDSIDDAALADLVTSEEPRIQATLILAVSERRASSVLARLSYRARQELLVQIMIDTGLDKEEVPALIARLQSKVKQIAGDSTRLIGSGASGAEALLPILKTMDFATQFASAAGFLGLPAAQKAKVQANYFNVALLPDCNPTFISELFLDQEGDWIQTVLSVFPKDFQVSVVNLLPPFQQRMLEGEWPVVPKAAAMSRLSELNDKVLGRIESLELSYQMVYNTQQEEAPGEEPAAAA